MAAHHGAHPYVAKPVYQTRKEFLSDKNHHKEFPSMSHESEPEVAKTNSDTLSERKARLLSSGTNLNDQLNDLAVCSGINLASKMVQGRGKPSAQNEQKVSAIFSHVALTHNSISCGPDHSVLDKGRHHDLSRD